MRFQSRIVHSLDQRMSVEESCDLHRVRLLDVHSTASVLIPRSTSHASNGEHDSPRALQIQAIFLACSGDLDTTQPPTTSECPLMYLVVECITMSTPNSIGRCRYGDRNVLSQIVMMLCFFAIDTIAAMSTTLSSGLLGVSIQMPFVAGVTDASTLLASVMSTKVNEIPLSFKNLSKSRNVPPYRSAGAMTWSRARTEPWHNERPTCLSMSRRNRHRLPARRCFLRAPSGLGYRTWCSRTRNGIRDCSSKRSTWDKSASLRCCTVDLCGRRRGHIVSQSA